MKLLYLIAGEYLSNNNSGVGSKIVAKARALKSIGVDVRVVEFSGNTAHNVDELCEVMRAPDGNYLEAIHRYLDAEAARFDKILFRYPFAHKTLLDIVMKHGEKIFFEHNTFESEEMAIVQKNHFKSLPFSPRPSYLNYWYRTFIQKTNVEKKLGAKILKHVAGGICVTHELAAYEAKKCNGYRTFVVSNGAPEATDRLCEIPPFTNCLKTFMLVGADAPWHGYERVIEGLKTFNDPAYRIEFHLIGVPSLSVTALPDNCSVTYSPGSANYFKEHDLHNFHVAFSTMALYKKGMKEAASLKLRDCMLRGFPVVVGYNDTDLIGSEPFSTYVHQVSNDSGAVDFTDIIKFYLSVRKSGNYPLTINKLASDAFSYTVKARALKQILEQN